jgi:HlyD family secretion protein
MNQVIARIDPEIFDAKVNQARADVASSQAAVANQEAQVQKARADVENARAALAEAKANTAKAQVGLVDSKRDLERKSELFRRELIAKSDLDSSQAAHDSAQALLEAARAKELSLAAAIESAIAQLRVVEAQLQASRAQVDQKKAALAQAQADLDHTTIRAPVNGVVVSRAVDVGQTIAEDLTKMQVEVSVDEADIGRIKLEDRATFTVDSFPGQPFSGLVVQIRKAALVVQNVVTYTVVVAVDNPGGRLLPGMTANVKMIVAEKPSVVKVPNAALRFRPAGSDGLPAAAGPAASGGSDAGQPGRPGAGGRPSAEQIRERLVQGLGLSAEQQKKLDPILADSRQQMMALQGVADPERQARVRKVREATRARIRELLTPEQRVKYDEYSGGSEARGTDPRSGAPGRVWVVDGDKTKAVPLTLGISDGAATEVLAGDLREGQEVIVGAAGGTGNRPAQGGTSGGPPRLRL